VTVDCEVLQADGGTRTASITGGFIALVDALRSEFGSVPREAYPLRDSVAAISVGLIDGQAYLDLDYEKDVAADVDMNVVMTGKGRFIEVQGTGEEATFDDQELATLIGLAKQGIVQLTEIQKSTLAADWPFG
jgi:ribonuclease PH